ncbi:unnamed protein product [Nesidiocoris tenuis]|uniref:Transmembrane Fragile-X-F protein n=2 Tax=Nesidiocoris tenuis TaxID=355587 RepID=A0ABN7BGH1_9HEMI|nr:Transmembrane Fragile-X-F protein [Nesidiocoris tenuis]CAB0007615.1 unnamed protein product [Nesidiocoris tenuis]
MALLHRALFTWFVVLVFLILLVLKLDNRIQWNWSIVFIPVWFYDSIVFLYVFFYILAYSRCGELSQTVRRKLYYLVALLLKFAFLVLLCLKLENVLHELSVVYVLLPLWILMPFAIYDVTMRLILNSKNRYL